MEDLALLEQALYAREKAYCPYSQFAVGAALQGADGQIFLGANIENAAYPITLCAERAAVAQAVCAGVKQFAKLAVITNAKSIATPCGMCRQMLVEFFNAHTQILCSTLTELKKQNYQAYSMEELLPKSFNRQHL